MQLHEVGEVMEVFDATTLKVKVAEGWTFIAVVPMSVPTPAQKGPCCYVLGKSKAAPVSATLKQFQEQGAFEPPKK